MMDSQKVFYCYSINLFHFLRQRKFYYLHKGTHERTGRVFWSFDGTEEFNKALTEYGINNPKK